MRGGTGHEKAICESTLALGARILLLRKVDIQKMTDI